MTLDNIGVASGQWMILSLHGFSKDAKSAGNVRLMGKADCYSYVKYH